MDWIYDDGGRAAAGYKGDTGDCVTRAVAIGTGLSYQQVYDALNAMSAVTKHGKRQKPSNSRTGVHRRVYEPFLLALGWTWTPTMRIGQGCTVHLRADELPSGTLIVAVSKHLVTVVDGVIRDNHNPARGGTRCVYGYYQKVAA